VVSNFVEVINSALFMSLSMERKSKHNIKSLTWNSEIYEYRCNVKQLYVKWKQAVETKLKTNLEKDLLTAKQALKYAIRREERKKMKKLITSIENLRSKDPSMYWKKLYQLDLLDRMDNSVPLVVRNSKQELVSGNEALLIWKESFRLLGLDDSNDTDFNTEFVQLVLQEVEKYTSLDDTTKCEEISIAEVERAVKRLQKGKAVGVDGLMNEVFKYGWRAYASCLIWCLARSSFLGLGLEA